MAELQSNVKVAVFSVICDYSQAVDNAMRRLYGDSVKRLTLHLAEGLGDQARRRAIRLSDRFAMKF